MFSIVGQRRNQAKPRAPRIVRGHPLSRGLVAYLPFGDGSGLPRDIGGQLGAPSAVVGAPTWTMSRDGIVPAFSSAIVGYPNLTALNGRTKWSIGFRARPSSATGPLGVISKRDSRTVNNNFTISYFWGNTDFSVVVGNAAANDTAIDLDFTGTAISTTVPQTIVVVFDTGAAAGSRVFVYLEGNPLTVANSYKDTDPGGGLAATSALLTLGRSQVGEGNFAGEIYCAAIWNRMLSRSEAQLFTADPYSLCRFPRPIALPMAITPAVGTSTFSLAGDTAACTAVSTPPTVATSTFTLAGDTAAGSAAVTPPPASAATSTFTLAGGTAACTATAVDPAPSSATLGLTLAGDTAASTATSTPPGVATATATFSLAGDTAASTATVTPPANAAATLAATLAGDSVSGSATHTGPAASTATLSATLADASVSATATASGVSEPADTPRHARPSSFRFNARHPLARGLVGAWPFAGGTKVQDLAGIKPVTLTGTSVQAAPSGPLPSFSGTASGTGGTQEIARTQPFSVALSAAFVGTSASQVLLSTRGAALVLKGWEVGFNAALPGSTKGFYLNLTSDWNAGNYLEQAGTFTPVVGRVYRLCFTYNGSSNASGVQIYCDGSPLSKPAATQNNLSGATTTSGYGVTWATTPAGTSRFAGALGDVLIWTRALSASEAAADALDPYGPVRPRSKRPVLAVPVTVTASVSATLAGDTAAGSATHTGPAPSTATVAATLGDASASLSGSATEPGIASATASATLAGDAAAFTSAVVPHAVATAPVTLAGDTAAGTATATAPGSATASASVTLSGGSAAGTATVTPPAPSSATLSITLADGTASGSASATTPGSAVASIAKTLAGDSASATATVTAPAASTATLAVTTEALTVSVAAAVPITGPTHVRPSSPRLNHRHPLANGLVAAWPYQGGKTTPDLIGGNDLSLTATTTAASRWGYLPAFNGGTSVGLAKRPLNFNDNQPFSIAVSAESNSTTGVLLSTIDGNNIGWEFSIEGNLGAGSTIGLSFYLARVIYGDLIRQGAAFKPVVGQPYRLAVTYDGSGLASGVRFYANGLPLNKLSPNQDTLGSGAAITSTSAPRLGQSQFPLAAPSFSGRLGDALVWSRVLSPDELAADARDPLAPFRPRSKRIFLAAPSSTLPLHLATLGSDAVAGSATVTPPPASSATLSVTLESASASGSATYSEHGKTALTLDAATAAFTAETTGPAPSEATFAVSLADDSATFSANADLAIFAIGLADDTFAFVSSPSFDATATIAATPSLGSVSLAAVHGKPSVATVSASLYGAWPSLSATRTGPASATASVSFRTENASASFSARGESIARGSVTLAGATPWILAESAAPPASAATFAVTTDSAAVAGTSAAAAPSPRTATASPTLVGVVPALAATAGLSSVISVSPELAGASARFGATSVSPALSRGTIAVTTARPTATFTAIAGLPANAAASASIVFAGATPAVASTAATPRASAATIGLTVGPAATLLAATERNAEAPISLTGFGVAASFAAVSTTPPASTATLSATLAAGSVSAAAVSVPPAPSSATIRPALAGAQARLAVTTTIPPETRGTLRLARNWDQVKRLLGTHFVTLERIPENIAQGDRGSPITTWELVPGFGSVEVVITMTDATIENSGLTRQGRRTGKILTATPLPTLGPNYRFLFNDPLVGSRYLNCTPERNLAQMGELWAVGVEEYP